MDKMHTKNITLKQGLAYSLPIVVTSFLFFPVQMLLTGLYAKHFGLALTTIASIVFAARLFDAMTDPLIGYFSDRHRSHTGSRKPWIVIGSILLVVCSYFLWTPPANVSAGYFMIWYFAFYLAWTVVDIPHLAWGGELAPCTHEKTRVYSLRAFCWFAGSVFFFAAPLLPIFLDSGFTPETMKWSVLASALVVVPVLAYCVKATPNGLASQKYKKQSFRMVFNAVIGNKPLMILLAGYFLISFSYGIYIGLSFIFADVYLGIGDKLPLAYLISSLCGLVGAWVPYRFAQGITKIAGYSWAVMLTAVTFAAVAFIEPGMSWIYFAILTGSVFFSNSVLQVLVPSLLSDIADYGSWKFGVDRSAMYFSSYLFLQKTNVGIGGAFALAFVGLYGFDATAITHSGTSVLGLRIAIGLIPALLMIISLVFIAKIPINTRRHKVIQKRLFQRAQRIEKNRLKTGSTIIRPNAQPIVD